MAKKDKNQLTGRDEDGKFIKGQSGNPRGRPAGGKNRITQLKQDLEIAIREKVSVHRIANVVDKMLELAEEGDKGAAKIILDKFVSMARDGEDTMDNRPTIQVTITNEARPADTPPSNSLPPIEGESTTIEE